MVFRNLTILAVAASMAGSLNTALGQWPPLITYPEALNNTATSDDSWETIHQIISDGRGNWMAIWDCDDDLDGTIGADLDLLFAHGTMNGAVWSDPAPINSNATTDSGADGLWGADVATDGHGQWVAVWTSWDDLGGTIGTDMDILISYSTDNGASWSPATPFNPWAASDGAFQDSDSGPVISTDNRGTWLVAWASSYDLDGTICGDWDYLFSRSTDNGATWTEPAALNGDAYGCSGSDWSLRLATDAQGHWVAVWGTDGDLGGTIGTDPDIVLAHSADNGATWTYPVPIAPDAAFDTNDEFVSTVATDGRGTWVAVWVSRYDDGGTPHDDLWFSRSTNNGANWSIPKMFTPSGNMPSLVADGLGRFIVVWASSDDYGGTGPDNDLFVSYSMDGTTWAPPAILNAYAYSDLGNDNHPRLATDGHGNWVAAWVSAEDHGGIGNDQDILTARFHMTPIPAVSTWGLLAMTLLVLSAGTLVLLRRRVAT